jgi:hypothetical protein
LIDVFGKMSVMFHTKTPALVTSDAANIRLNRRDVEG